ncbi:hypothetical protein EVAR_92034_1 [Eumeta japonica]|uniref:Uncharacterized protein n=1 Tax=Eumeta variegata TaxID=151549 RepID=A0A4C1SYV9_EUMVA|nr:hypothetical protein EVAR_92034_1 [Eumeta japonica]
MVSSKAANHWFTKFMRGQGILTDEEGSGELVTTVTREYVLADSPPLRQRLTTARKIINNLEMLNIEILAHSPCNLGFNLLSEIRETASSKVEVVAPYEKAAKATPKREWVFLSVVPSNAAIN